MSLSLETASAVVEADSNGARYPVTVTHDLISTHAGKLGVGERVTFEVDKDGSASAVIPVPPTVASVKKERRQRLLLGCVTFAVIAWTVGRFYIKTDGVKILRRLPPEAWAAMSPLFVVSIILIGVVAMARSYDKSKPERRQHLGLKESA